MTSGKGGFQKATRNKVTIIINILQSWLERLQSFFYAFTVIEVIKVQEIKKSGKTMYRFTQCLLKMDPDCISEYHFWQKFSGGNPQGPPMEERRCPSIPSLNGEHALL